MKLARSLAYAMCVSSMVFGSGCASVSDWWGGLFEDDSAIESTELAPLQDFENFPTDGIDIVDINDIDGLGEFTPDSEIEAAIESADGEWQVIPGRLNFPIVYFAYNQERIGSSERAKLESVAGYLTQYASVGLIIEGHCDERGSAEFNRALGERRAIAVKDFLISSGVPEDRIKTLSFGEEKPAGESLAKNRRAELIPARM